MRVISWNVRKNPRAIEFALGELGADVLLAQECNVLSRDGLYSTGSFIDERWVAHKWGNVIFSKTPLETITVNTEYQGSLSLAAVDSPLGLLGLINIYGLFEKASPDSSKKLATPGMHRKLSDLSPLLWGKSEDQLDAFLVMGDFNHDRRMDEHKNFRRIGAAPFSGLFKRIEDFQLTDLLQRDFPEGVKTYHAVRGNFPWQLDHAFISSKVAGEARVRVLFSDEIDSMSDHRPVVVELNPQERSSDSIPEP